MCKMVIIGIQEVLVELIKFWTQNFRFAGMSKYYYVV